MKRESYTAAIWDTKTNHVRRVKLKHFSSFSWEEGNDSCDCNRYRYFYNDYEFEHPCGDSRFKLLCIEKDNKFHYVDSDGNFIPNAC